MKRSGLVGLSILSIVLMLMLGACNNQEAAEPVAVDEKTDTCATCNMSVANDQHATQFILEDGKSLKFDDIGCMYKWKKENEDKKVEQGFVRDFDTEEWINEEDATYVYGAEIDTPMSYHVISFKNADDAKAYAEEHSGEVLSYSDLANHEWAMDKKKGMHSHSM